MHDFLRAVGFSSVHRRKELDQLIEYVKKSPTERSIIPIGADCSLVQIDKYFSDKFGLSIVGEYDENDEFHFDHIFPFCNSGFVVSEDGTSFKKISDKEAYEGFCEDYNVGCSLIFYLQNVSDYVRSCWSNVPSTGTKEIRFAGLSIEGTVILGVTGRNEEEPNGTLMKAERKKLMMYARKGSQKAMEMLTMDDMKTYSTIRKRVVTEDVLSIVDTSFIPYGVECDQYSVVGVIMLAQQYQNEYTGENVWVLMLSCNDLMIDVCINEKDLVGEPEIGRRFKGVMWLQGFVEFNS